MIGARATDNYSIVRQAIVNRYCLTATYKNHELKFSPYALGRSASGDLSVMALQYEGLSSNVALAVGEWRCFRINALTDLRKNNDHWRVAPDRSRPMTCVARVDVQAQ